ncbi:MAG: hypothetical protein WD226_02335 [Planctomycetota bacterium]
MHLLAKASVLGLLTALAPSIFADGRNPGSLLVYPVQRSGFDFNGGPEANGGAPFFTVASVTNTNLNPIAGSTQVHFEYVNKLENDTLASCYVNNVFETLTPADTLSVLTACHNSPAAAGYLVVTAKNPATFDTYWSFNYLIGSELVVTSRGSAYAMNAMPFESPLAEGLDTDLDLDDVKDFDGAEYEGIPEYLYIDSHIAATGGSLALINMTGGTDFIANVKFDAWNDNERQLSATYAFKCWDEVLLFNIGSGTGFGPGTIFNDNYLFFNTLNSPFELDVDCDGLGDVETSWARINGINASSNVESVPNAALLGAMTGSFTGFTTGRLLWESRTKQLNGDFLNFGGDDPEFP